MNAERVLQVREVVRQRYANVAEERECGCGGEKPSSCCGAADAISLRMGYSEAEVASVPEGANLGLGCGNPGAIASLKPGEVVLDLGSGGGLDCFLAAQQVGGSGSVIGVDMTPEMVLRARNNARKGGYANVEFRLGEIERLPVADESVDVIISNCVINLSPDKPAVFREAFRVLKPGGRLAISDVVATADLPEEARADPDLLSGCVAGAERVDALKAIMKDAGFLDVRITPKDESREFIKEWDPRRPLHEYIVSATIEASKPA